MKYFIMNPSSSIWFSLQRKKQINNQKTPNKQAKQNNNPNYNRLCNCFAY